MAAPAPQGHRHEIQEGSEACRDLERDRQLRERHHRTRHGGVSLAGDVRSRPRETHPG